MGMKFENKFLAKKIIVGICEADTINVSLLKLTAHGKIERLKSSLFFKICFRLFSPYSLYGILRYGTMLYLFIIWTGIGIEW